MTDPAPPLATLRLARPAAPASQPVTAHPTLAAGLPWWPAFFPGQAVPEGGAPLLPPGIAALPAALRCAPSFWKSPRFGQRFRPVGLITAPAAATQADPLAGALAAAGAAPDAEGLAALMVELRVGGVAGLEDPGPAGLGLPRGEAVVVIDPCITALAPAARALLAAAERLALEESRFLLIAAAPGTVAGAAPCLPTPTGARRLPPGLAPWTLVDLAAALFGAEEPAGLLALAAGTRFLGTLPGGLAPGPAALPRLFAASRWADPFRESPAGAEQGLRQLADWRIAAAANRRVAVCLNMQFWKRPRMAALFARSDGTTPAFHRRPGPALAEATRQGGAIAVWATRMPPDLPRRAADAGCGLLYVEDGFIRSAGLGAGFLPGASFALDSAGPYYDPAIASDLERLLAETCFAPALLHRAEALRSAIVRSGISKYNLDRPGAAALPGLPARLAAGGPRRVILVPGQVANDASVRRGGGAVQDNLALLRAVRREAPEAFLVYKPHPDVTAGYRPGRIAEAQLAEFADLVLPDAPIIPLIEAVDEVHTLTSQAGFEALLRDRAVTTHGQPFYAGWGLTTDRHPVARRGRQLSLGELVAGCLILYPRYVDPVTELPCPVELVLERLADPRAWRRGRLARLRDWQGAAVARLARAMRRR